MSTAATVDATFAAATSDAAHFLRRTLGLDVRLVDVPRGAPPPLRATRCCALLGWTPALRQAVTLAPCTDCDDSSSQSS